MLFKNFSPAHFKAIFFIILIFFQSCSLFLDYENCFKVVDANTLDFTKKTKLQKLEKGTLYKLYVDEGVFGSHNDYIFQTDEKTFYLSYSYLFNTDQSVGFFSDSLVVFYKRHDIIPHDDLIDMDMWFKINDVKNERVVTYLNSKDSSQITEIRIEELIGNIYKLTQDSSKKIHLEKFRSLKQYLKFNFFSLSGQLKLMKEINIKYLSRIRHWDNGIYFVSRPMMFFNKIVNLNELE